jgi:rSAM/selenodomain-associated transferase 2
MSQSPPGLRLSIVVPSHNESGLIGGLLSDLAPLRAQGHEIILADGGSDDRTLEVAAPLVDRIVSSARGRAVQLNAGAQAAAGDVLWFLHADTRVPPDASERLIQACGDGRHWGRFDVRLSGSQRLLRLIETMMNLRSCATGVATGDQGIFVLRTLFETVAGFPDIPLMEDVTLSKRLRRHARPHCIRQPRLQTSSRRWEQNGIVATVVLMWRLRLAYFLGVAPGDLAKRYR